MGKSSAQRQREYRRRRSEGEGESRVNTWLSTSANLALERLAAHHEVTKKEMLERIIAAEDKNVIDGIDDGYCIPGNRYAVNHCMVVRLPDG